MTDNNGKDAQDDLWIEINAEQKHRAAEKLEALGLSNMRLDTRHELAHRHLVTIYRSGQRTHTVASDTIREEHIILLMGPAGDTGLVAGEQVEIDFDHNRLTVSVEKIEPARRLDDQPGNEIVWLHIVTPER